MNLLWTLFVLGLLAVGQAFLFVRFGLRRIDYSRQLSRSSVFEGERVELVEVLQNRKILPVPRLRAESRMSPYLQFASSGLSENDRTVNNDQYHKSIFFLPPYNQVTRRYPVTCVKRGYYKLDSVSLTAGDLLGFGSKSRTQEINCTLSVYPRILSREELIHSRHWQGDISVRRWIAPDPFLVSGIRSYQQGDALRDVHWPATARTGALQVKARDYTANPKLLVLLNVQIREDQWGNLMKSEQEIVEHGLRLAATLCTQALRNGIEAGFGSNSSLSKEDDPLLILPQSGSNQRHTLLEAMARFSMHRNLSFNTYLDRLQQIRDTDVLILSAYDAEALRRHMHELEKRGNSVSLVRLHEEVPYEKLV